MQTDTKDFDLFALVGKGDTTIAGLNAAREAAPLFWSEKSQCWIVSGHKHVTEAFSGRLPLSNAHIPRSLYPVIGPEEMQARMPKMLRYVPLWVTNSDGTDHIRRRKMLTRAFGRKTVDDLRPYVQARVKLLIEKAASRGELEFNEEIARLLPGAVILRLFGMSEDYLQRLKGWADAFGGGLGGFHPSKELLDALERATCEMEEVFTAEIDARRKSPGTDLISELLSVVDEGGGKLSMDELIGALMLIIVAGHDTTANTMTLGIRALSRLPDAWNYWRANPEKSLECANELMRYIAMTTIMPRVVAEDFEWHGQSIRQGQLMIMMIAGGNRDPNIFPSPNLFDPTRSNEGVLTFGAGLHHCLGHLLAKLQVTEFFSALTQRFDAVEVIGEPEFLPNMVFRGVDTLHVRFIPNGMH